MLVADWQRPDHLGRLNPKVWSDIDNIDEITSMPLDARHRNTDKIIQDAGVRHSDKLKTAICCPPGTVKMKLLNIFNETLADGYCALLSNRYLRAW